IVLAGLIVPALLVLALREAITGVGIERVACEGLAIPLFGVGEGLLALRDARTLDQGGDRRRIVGEHLVQQLLRLGRFALKAMAACPSQAKRRIVRFLPKQRRKKLGGLGVAVR